MTLTLVDVQPGDETVSYQSSTGTLKDVDEEERRSRHGFNGGDHAFDDEPTLTARR